MNIAGLFSKRNRNLSAEEQAAKAAADQEALMNLKPLPIWFFAFEGVFGGAYDIIKTAPQAWIALVVIWIVNMVVTLTVLGKRRKLVRAMLKNSRTRSIAIGLIALRLGCHLALTALGTALTSAGGHLVMAGLMTVISIGLLWFDQRVTFRTLGIPTDGDRKISIAAAVPVSA